VLLSVQAVLGVVSSSRRVCSISRAVAGSNPALAGGLVFVRDRVLQPGDVLRGVGDPGGERVRADIHCCAAIPVAGGTAAAAGAIRGRAQCRGGEGGADLGPNRVISVSTRMDRQPHRSGLSAGVCSRCWHT
jgi:hypothetical protein